ncbi:MAG: flippase [Actinobacteria bacterium]|nr:MAG: flippase [Actinomycetota bacterium]
MSKASTPAPGRNAASSNTVAVGERAIMNTLYRSGGEVVGRLASLLLFVEAGRTLGTNGLGAFVFAVAYMGFVMVWVDIGLDRYLLRAGARARAEGRALFFNVLGLKLALALPLFAVGFLVLHEVGYGHQAQATTWALAPGVFSDSVARTQLSFFLSHERAGPPSFADAIQRVCSAALGIAALRAGYGVVSVGVTYSAGSMIGVIIGFVLLARTIGVPRLTVNSGRWRGLAARSLPFAAQDTFAVLLARADTLILAAIATQAAVGRYGAAYRLFESTLLITAAIAGAFAAMFTYLGPDSDPPLRAVFQRSIKLSLVLLAPVAVAFAVLARPICRLIYGSGFSAASLPLRILAPAVLLMAIVTLSNSLMLSRENPRQMVSLAAAMAGVNVVLNLILIPLFSDAGAAAAMLATELVYAACILRMSTGAVGRLGGRTTVAGAGAGAAGMVAVTLLLNGSPWLGLALGGGAYLLGLIAVERLVSPIDVELVTSMVRRLLPSRSA